MVGENAVVGVQNWRSSQMTIFGEKILSLRLDLLRGSLESLLSYFQPRNIPPKGFA
jgi:hypothetical protein